MSCGKATTRPSTSNILTTHFINVKFQRLGHLLVKDLTKMQDALDGLRKRLEKLEQNPTVNQLQLPPCPEEDKNTQLKTARPDRSDKPFTPKRSSHGMLLRSHT